MITNNVMHTDLHQECLIKQFGMGPPLPVIKAGGAGTTNCVAVF